MKINKLRAKRIPGFLHCHYCGRYLPPILFPINISKTNGRGSRCRTCHPIYEKQKRHEMSLEDRAVYLGKLANYRQEHPNYMREWRAKNKERRAQYQRDYRNPHKKDMI